MSDTNSNFQEESGLWRAVSSETENAYFLALGRFVHRFAQTESRLKSYLAYLTNIDTHTANAIFSGMRMKPAMDSIRRINERYNREPDPAYASVTDQLGQILSARDSIIHFGAKLSDRCDAFVTNARYAHSEKAIREFPISPEALIAMTNDLTEIHNRIYAAECRSWMDEETFKIAFGDLEPPTWQYKHAPQPRKQGKMAPKDQTR